MYFFDIPLEEIKEEHLQNLLDDKFSERQQLDYKRDMYKNTPEDTIELCKDISAMANSFGGRLIIGIEDDEKDGVPTEIVGIENAEASWDRIQNICSDCIDQRILGLKHTVVSLENGREALVISIPRSSLAPHLVRKNRLRSFFIRHERHNPPMTLNEIRDAVLRVENYMKRAEECLQSISDKYVRQKTDYHNWVVLSAVPVFLEHDIIDINDKKIVELIKNVPCELKVGASLCYPQREPEPFIYGIKSEFDPEQKTNYYQRFELHSNGYSELLLMGGFIFNTDNTTYFSAEKVVSHIYHLSQIYLISNLILHFSFLKALFEHLGQLQPILYRVGIYNCNDLKYDAGVIRHYTNYKEYKEQHLVLPIIRYETIDDPEKMACKVITKFQNVFGAFKSPYFDENGKITEAVKKHYSW